MADISHFYHLCSTRGNENDEISEYLLFTLSYTFFFSQQEFMSGQFLLDILKFGYVSTV